MIKEWNIKKLFLEKTKKLEGYLFPNTYEFIGNESEDELIDVAQKEFAAQTEKMFAKLSEKEKKNWRQTTSSVL